MNLSYRHNRKFAGERKKTLILRHSEAIFVTRVTPRDRGVTSLWPILTSDSDPLLFIDQGEEEDQEGGVQIPRTRGGSPSSPRPKWRHIHKKDPPESLMKPLTVSEGVVKFSLWSALSLGPSQLQQSGMSSSGLLCLKSSKPRRCCTFKKTWRI